LLETIPKTRTQSYALTLHHPWGVDAITQTSETKHSSPTAALWITVSCQTEVSAQTDYHSNLLCLGQWSPAHWTGAQKSPVRKQCPWFKWYSASRLIQAGPIIRSNHNGSYSDTSDSLVDLLGLRR
jgi:hypothetical protein